MKAKRQVHGYRLSDGEHRVWQSMTDCGASIGRTPQNVSFGIKNGTPVNGWCLAERADVAASMYENGGNATEPKRRSGKKVPLRIDSRTVIYVDSNEANEKFAEYYRKRLNQ